jgi:hypothetical protein
MEQNVNIELTVNEVNMVLVALSKAPYEQVADLITKVRGQVIPQLPAQEAAPEEAPAAE